MADIKREVLSAIAIGAINAAKSANTSVTERDAGPIATMVANEVVPLVEHATNSEPWYQSRVTLGALLAAASGIAGIFGYTFGIDDQARVVDLILALGPVIGAALALYGRWAAKKPLGQ